MRAKTEVLRLKATLFESQNSRIANNPQALSMNQAVCEHDPALKGRPTDESDQAAKLASQTSTSSVRPARSG